MSHLRKRPQDATRNSLGPPVSRTQDTNSALQVPTPNGSFDGGNVAFPVTSLDVTDVAQLNTKRQNNEVVSANTPLLEHPQTQPGTSALTEVELPNATIAEPIEDSNSNVIEKEQESQNGTLMPKSNATEGGGVQPLAEGAPTEVGTLPLIPMENVTKGGEGTINDEPETMTLRDINGPDHDITGRPRPTLKPKESLPHNHTSSHVDNNLSPSLTEGDDDGDIIIVHHCTGVNYLSCKVKAGIHSHPVAYGVSMVLIFLLCYRRCRAAAASREGALRGEYRAVAAQYEEMLFDNFNDEYSAGADDRSVVSNYSDDDCGGGLSEEDDWSSGPRRGIELTSMHRPEVNGGLTLEEMNG